MQLQQIVPVLAKAFRCCFDHHVGACDRLVVLKVSQEWAACSISCSLIAGFQELSDGLVGGNKDCQWRLKTKQCVVLASCLQQGVCLVEIRVRSQDRVLNEGAAGKDDCASSLFELTSCQSWGGESGTKNKRGQTTVQFLHHGCSAAPATQTGMPRQSQ